MITLDPNAYGTKCIAASGNDVYIASQTGLSTEVIIFKNGVMQKLGPHTKAYDMFLLEFNVYVPGFEGSGADTAIYWKNGQAVKLSAGRMTTGIFVNGNDVYCSGL